MIYLDHAATTPVPRAVADAMYQVLTEDFANPSAQYPAGVAVKKRLDGWRAGIAGTLGCPAERLFFTSCGTESDSWAVTAACYRNRHLGRHIVVSAVEHSAVLEAVRRMEREAGYTATYLRPDRNGVLTADAVLGAVRPDTALVSLMLVNNETGNRYPVEAVARGLPARNPETLLHTDAVQGFFKTPFAAAASGVDFAAVSAHKIGGPKGIGALYIGPRVRNPRPFLPGGGQEGGLRSGTEATAQIAGFAKAAELRAADLPGVMARMEAVYRYALERLREIPDLVFLGGASLAASGLPETSRAPDACGAGYAPHILAFALAGWPSQNVVNELGGMGICISAGSACHRGKPSHVVEALGLPRRVRLSAVRASFGPETTQADIDALAAALRRHHDTRMPML